MKRREAMAAHVASTRTAHVSSTRTAHVASTRTARVVLPSNGHCPTSNLPYWNCRCDNHRCGDCGRRWSQRSEHGTYHSSDSCQCERNRRRNGFPPHWRRIDLLVKNWRDIVTP